MVPDRQKVRTDGRTEGRTEWTDGRTDDAKTISLRLRRGILMTIYSKFRFDYHKGKQPGMVNAHLPLKCPYSLTNYGIFKTLRHVGQIYPTELQLNTEAPFLDLNL